MTMRASILVTRPNHDRMTRYLSAWAGKFMDEAAAKGHTVHTLKDKKVTKTNFESMVAKVRPEVIFINGHGGEDRIGGHDNEVILDADSCSITVGAKVYALSCKTAVSLGPDAMASGAAAYIGYAQDFMLVSQPQNTHQPLEDETAALFLEPSNQIVGALAKGHDAKTAVAKGMAAYSRSIQKALNSDIQSDDDKYISFLLWDRMFLTNCSKNKPAPRKNA